MLILSPILYFILANGFFVFVTKKSFGKCLPLTFMIVAFSYYFSQFIFLTFKFGFILNLLFAFLFIFINIKKLLKKENLKEFKNNYFSKGFLAFIIFYFFITLFYFNRAFTTWDEYSHWGYMIKGMLKYDSFYTECLLDLNHRDYPPIIQLFELFYINLTGAFKESTLTSSIHLLSISFFLPAVCDSKLENKKIKKIFIPIAVTLIVFFSILFFDGHEIINTVYIDYLIAIIVAYLLYLVLFEEKLYSNFFLVNLAIGLSFLVLTKQIAICFYLMILFLYFGLLIIKKQLFKRFTKNHFFNLLKIICLLVIIPLFVFMLWNNYIDNFDLYQQFDVSDIKLFDFFNILLGRSGETWQKETFVNFVEAFFNKTITTSYIKFSYLQAFILVILLLLVICFLFKKKIVIKDFKFLLLTLIIGFFGYAFVMMLTYVFCFGEREGVALASFDRYMVTYILIGICLVIMIFIKFNDKKQLSKYAFLIMALILIQNSNNLVYMVPNVLYRGTYVEHKNTILNNTKKGDKIYFIAQGEDFGDSFNRLRFYLFDEREISSKYYNLKTYNEDFYFNTLMPYILNYDYLYIVKTSDILKIDYKFLFIDEPLAGNLYKIINDNSELKLELVNE